MTYHKEFACCHEGCAALICLTPEQEAKLRRTHEDFRCPFGHVQGFYGQTKEEKRIEQLERKLEQYKRMYHWRGETIADLKAELRSRSARIGVGTRKLRQARERASRKRVAS